MGVLLYVLAGFGAHLIALAPQSVVTVFDLSNCYTAPPVALPCEHIAYRTGGSIAVLYTWCGLLLLAVAAWLAWDLWSATAPKPITDDFLKLLEDSFARDWRKPRTWPWTRVAWAFGFALIGVIAGARVSRAFSAFSASPPPRAPIVRVDTTEHFTMIK
jgi:hypothetical protein